MTKNALILVFVLLLSSLVINFSQKQQWKTEAIVQNKAANQNNAFYRKKLIEQKNIFKQQVAELSSGQDSVVATKNKTEDANLKLQFYLNQLKQENERLRKENQKLLIEVIKWKSR